MEGVEGWDREGGREGGRKEQKEGNEMDHVWKS